jgi:hypothetical protein
LNITVVIKFIMDRFSSISNLNHKYGNRDATNVNRAINSAIASNVLPITFQSGFDNYANQSSYLNAPSNLYDKKIATNLPISISDAQREVVNPYNGFSRMTTPQEAHESRIGEVMY